MPIRVIAPPPHPTEYVSFRGHRSVGPNLVLVSGGSVVSYFRGRGGLGEQGFSSGVFNFGCENFNFLQHPQITHCLKAINKYKLTHTCLGVLYELAHT